MPISRRDLLMMGGAFGLTSFALAGCTANTQQQIPQGSGSASIDASAASNGATLGVIAQTTAGPVRGYTYQGVHTFKGIPYAKAERFGMPQAPDGWEVPRTCFVWGAICPQTIAYESSPSVTAFSEHSDADLKEREDECLNLNVWTKSLDGSAGKPVIVFIHGGGFTSGSSSEVFSYDGTNIVGDKDVVFVSVNHRLNCLGFLDLSAYGEEFRYSGNAGMADLVAALKWVRDNIANFGGDPENVTIVGQSGGGGKVLTLMAMPEAQGLFKRAWCMSGGISARTQDEAVAQTAALVEQLGVTGNAPEALRALSYSELAQAAAAAGFTDGPIVDGDYIPEQPVDPESGELSSVGADIPLIVSTVFSEMTGPLPQLLFANPAATSIADLYGGDIDAACQEVFGDHLDEVKEAFEAAYPEKAGDWVSMYYVNTARNNDLVLAKAHQTDRVWQAVFAYELPVFGGMMSWHTGGDIPFIFRNVNRASYLVAGDEENARAFQEVTSTALVNYATNGDPSSDSLPWDPFTEQQGETMIFDTESEVRGFHDQEFLKLVNEYGNYPQAGGPSGFLFS